MGTYGQGQAFGLRYKQHTAAPIKTVALKSPPPAKFVEVRQPVFCASMPAFSPQAFMSPAFCQQPKVNWTALALGAVAGAGMAVAGSKAQNNTPLTNQYSYLNTQYRTGVPTYVNYKQNLVEMYGKNYNIVDDGNGQFRATDKATMKSYGPASYDKMCELLGNV